jgi:ribosomal protein S12 methylthiotransferase accessory factor YcaO
MVQGLLELIERDAVVEVDVEEAVGLRKTAELLANFDPE